MDIVVLNMVLDSENLPDFGDIAINKDGDIVLLQGDIPLLLNNLTRGVCGDAFNIQVGQKAKIIDTGAVFVYHSNDRWYLSECKKFYFNEWQNPDDNAACCVELRVFQDNAAYVLADDEKIICSVIKKSDNSTAFSKTMIKHHYKGGGYYVYYLTKSEVTNIRSENDYTVLVSIVKGDNETDITDNFEIKDVTFMCWIYDID